MSPPATGFIRALPLRLAMVPLLALGACTDLPTEGRHGAMDPAPPPAFTVPLSIHDAECEAGTLESGAAYLVCVPAAGWNGELVVVAPGFHHVFAELPEPTGEIGGVNVGAILIGQGFAFATTNFPTTGLLEPSWVEKDIPELAGRAQEFLDEHGELVRAFMGGGSQGGLVTGHVIERSAQLFPDLFAGGLAACGPIGDFRRQIDYFGDFRVVFDYFFDPVLTDWPVWRQSNGNPDAEVGQDFIDDWPTVFEPMAAGALAQHRRRTAQLYSVTDVPLDPADPAGSAVSTGVAVLAYSTATNDAIAKLDGQPFDNTDRLYTGAANVFLLNHPQLGVERITTTGDAQDIMAADYETTGHLDRWLVTIHTTGDPIIPHWHADLYAKKTLATGSFLRHTHIPVIRYGHCNFTQEELLAAFALLRLQVTGEELLVSAFALPAGFDTAAFMSLARAHGASPVLVR